MLPIINSQSFEPECKNWLQDEAEVVFVFMDHCTDDNNNITCSGATCFQNISLLTFCQWSDGQGGIGNKGLKERNTFCVLSIQHVFMKCAELTIQVDKELGTGSRTGLGPGNVTDWHLAKAWPGSGLLDVGHRTTSPPSVHSENYSM